MGRPLKEAVTEFSQCIGFAWSMNYVVCHKKPPYRIKKYARACLKNHFRNLQAPLCGIFYPHSVAVARYAALIRIKSPTNWDSQLTKSLFQTRSRIL
ncbi:hypothetical protein DW961_11675 [Blautia sp. AM46-3MH]|nr:hypothetical protein DW961_11675 [Blautia sp. AM46-3MH]